MSDEIDIFERRLRDQQQQELQMQRRYAAARAAYARVLPVLRTLKRFYGDRLNFFLFEEAWICLRVTDMKQVEPVLEHLEEQLEIKFDRSEDHGKLGWREFSSSNLPAFRVEAEVDSTDPASKCRRVQDGFETIPKYKIVCDEDS